MTLDNETEKIFMKNKKMNNRSILYQVRFGLVKDETPFLTPAIMRFEAAF